MFQDLVKQLRDTISGQTALGYVQTISQFHRLPGFPGQVEAAREQQRLLRQAGLKSWMEIHPCDGQTKFWSEVAPSGWQVTKAELWASGDNGVKVKLCDFSEHPLSLMAHSDATPERTEPYEVVVIENPENPQAYEGLSLKDKVVLVGNCQMDRVVSLAVDVYGAAGVLTDRMREYPGARTKVDLADSHNWNGFDWAGHPGKCFGFSLTHRQAEWLRQQKNPLVYPLVEASHMDSEFANVLAYIPGRTDEEVLIVAHNCHPKPSANDNASGVAAGMEIMRSFHQLIQQKVLPQPKRGIRLLLTPEFTGTYAWLAQNEYRLEEIVAAVNLDMVGEDQTKCVSSLALERPPFAAGTYTALLLDHMLKLISDDASNYFKTSNFPLFRTTKTNFSGGSDHYILSDPSVGIQCAMISQWPDRHYHASTDTVDKVDPAMLARSATIAAGMVWVIADADSETAQKLSDLTYDQFFEEFLRLLDRQVDGTEAAQLREFLLQMKADDFARIEKLASDDEPLKQVNRSRLDNLRKMSQLYLDERYHVSSPVAEVEEEEQLNQARKIIPIRKFLGPVPLGLRGYIHQIGPERLRQWDQFLEKHPDGAKLEYLLLYYADGERNLADICRLVQLETGLSDVSYALQYIELLHELELIDMRVEAENDRTV